MTLTKDTQVNQTVVSIFGALTLEYAGSPCSTGPREAMVPYTAPGQDGASEKAQPGHSRAGLSLSVAS